MEEELKLDQAVPTLTFEPFTETKKEAPKPEPIYEEEALLSEQEKKQVEAFAEKIDLNNSTLVLQYGAGAQKKIADFSDKTLENVRSKDLGETGTMLASLVSELKQTGEPEEEKGFFASFFKKSTGKLEALKARYEKAEGKVDEIVDILTKHQVQLIQDAAMLDQMYQLNQTYFKELSMYILAGKKKVDKARQTELETLRQKAIASGTQEDAQAVSDYSSMIERESSYQPDAVSDTGDFGLMQINICNHRWLYEELGITDVMDPEQNIEAGLYILGRAFQKYDDPDKALMAYNMGDSGMKSAWSKGQHSSKYSRAVIETAQALKRKEH